MDLYEFKNMCRKFSNYEYDEPQCYCARCYLCRRWLRYQDYKNWKTNLMKNLIKYLNERRPFLGDKKERIIVRKMIAHCFKQIIDSKS